MLRRQEKIAVILGGMAGLTILAWLAIFAASSRQLKVVFFDVGQGSAVFVETPGKSQILIDGGPGPKIVEKLGRELPFWDREIDLIISTHPDEDHLVGLIEVLKSYQVRMIGSTGVVGKTSQFVEFVREAENENAERLVLKRGQKIIVGKNLVFEVLAPLEDFEGREVKDFNSSSLVFKASYGRVDFLLTGDSPVSVEKKLVEQEGENLDSEVLQVAHHGSNSSTSEAFLEAASPEIAVIEVGQNNRYGHPHPEVLERLAKHGIRTLRTDEQGDISFLSDGREIKIKN